MKSEKENIVFLTEKEVIELGYQPLPKEMLDEDDEIPSEYLKEKNNEL